MAGRVAPHVLWALVPGTDARPCLASDWSFVFGPCDEAEQRLVHALLPEEQFTSHELPFGSIQRPPVPLVCDPSDPESVPQPPPLRNFSCRHPCPAGSHVSMIVGAAHAPMTPTCSRCEPGTFSLGGGLLVSGVASDWRRPWPKEMSTSCMYADRSGNWFTLVQPLDAAPCQFVVSDPPSVAGNYSMAAATWNRGRAVEGRLRAAPGDGRACGPLEALPRGTVLLLRDGGCPAAEKAARAQRAGAVAVILAASRYNVAPPTVWPGPTGQDPGVPLVAMGRQEAEVLALAATLEENAVRVRIPEPGCVAHPVSVTAPGMPGDPSAQQPGCAPWVADPSGRFIYSGDNHRFHSVQTVLTLSVGLVRDGHVTFRYVVDSERGYDGLSFEVDYVEHLPIVSHQATFKEMRVELQAGFHNLRWWYSKDYDGSEGEDRAKLQLVEVVGTEHADLECRSCHSYSTHSGAGAAHCNACSAGEYLAAPDDTQLDVEKCSACPEGRWSPPGAVGIDGCQEFGPCTAADVVVEFTPCSGGMRRKQRTWRLPHACNPELPGSVRLDPQGEVPREEECDPCQPNMHRPDGALCVPVSLTCAQGQIPLRELAIAHWQSWPTGVSHGVDADSDGDADPDRASWRLVEKGDYVVAGDFSASSPALEGHTATLYFDVTVEGQPSFVTFHAEVEPPEAWGTAANFFVDEHVARGAEVRRGEANSLVVSAALSDGQHRLAWVWKHGHRPEVGAAAFRLLNISVTWAKAAGHASCIPCPAGHSPDYTALKCAACPPGRASSGVTCSECEAGRFSDRRASPACRRCGTGTTSRAGAASCEVEPELALRLPNGAESKLRSQPIVDAWNRALALPRKEGFAGPLTVAGHVFYTRIFMPPLTPSWAAGDHARHGAGHVWQLLDRGGEAERAAEDWCLSGSDSLREVESLGSHLFGVEPVTALDPHGDAFATVAVEARFRGGEPCADGSARSLTLRFVCDMSAVDPPQARKDHLGLYHLPRLRLSGVAEGVDGCDNVTLEWPSAAACPSCEDVGFNSQPGPCRRDGNRTVTFGRIAPCVGRSLPEPYLQACEASDAQTSSLPDDSTTWALQLFIGLAAGLGACLCSYACYLHCKFSKYAKMRDVSAAAPSTWGRTAPNP